MKTKSYTKKKNNFKKSSQVSDYIMLLIIFYENVGVYLKNNICNLKI